VLQRATIPITAFWPLVDGTATCYCHPGGLTLVVLVAVFKQKAQSFMFNLISLNSWPYCMWACVFAWACEQRNSNSQKTFKWQWQFHCGGPEKDKSETWLARSWREQRGRPACKVQQFYRLHECHTSVHTQPHINTHSPTYTHTLAKTPSGIADKSAHFRWRRCKWKK